jgi:hypothetical protein
MPENIPPHAVSITFDYDGVKGRIHLWDVRAPHPREAYVNWQWSALGNNGEEESYEKAIASARSWVRGLITKTDKEIE